MVFFTESWFWRGTQSAVFYYIACTPWVEYKHKRKRRQEATEAQKETEEAVIYTQPGVVTQPAPFQTNEDWAQEIVQGPGPPKGWKRDSIYYKYVRRFQGDDSTTPKSRRRGVTVDSTDSPGKSECTRITDSSTAVAPSPESLQATGTGTGTFHKLELDDLERLASRISTAHDPFESRQVTPVVPTTDPGLLVLSGDGGTFSRNGVDPLRAISSIGTASTGSKRASFESSLSGERRPVEPRPSMEKRLSTAMDGFKDAMRAALQPEHWNWIRYERDDEVLSNINERMRGMWGSMKEHITLPPEGQPMKAITNEPQKPKESQVEHQVKKWQRGTHPGVNDLSPPIVSQLPYTREEAHWILLPPPSADVMMGRARPDVFDDIKRKPMCIMGRPARPISESPDEVPAMSSDEENEVSDSGGEEWMLGWTHVQKPQRAHLWKRRASSYSPDMPPA